MKRNRIVINLDDPNLPRRKRRGGWGKPLLIIGVVLLVIGLSAIVGGYFWWRNYQSGPAYSLAVLVDAAHRNDAATIDKILDSEKISADFVAQVKQKTTGSSVASSLLPSQTDAAAAAVSAKLKDTVREQLIKQVRDLTDVAAGKPLFLIALAVPRFVSIDQQKDIAHATVDIKNEQIKLTMQPENNGWRVVAVQDEKLAKMVADAVVKNLPSSGWQMQDEIRKQLDKLQNR
jgi:hypothetical protein